MGARIRNAISSDHIMTFQLFPIEKNERCDRQKALCLSPPGHEKPLRAARKKIEFAWAAEPNQPGISEVEKKSKRIAVVTLVI